MRCSECNSENKPEAKFCTSCGAILVTATTSVEAGIRCSGCGSENKPEAKFCTGCGMKLVAPAAPSVEGVRCSECDFENAPGAKFCNNCGTQLIAPEAPSLEGIRCSECDYENAPGAKFCNNCGTQLLKVTSFCANCNTEIPSGQHYCSKCSEQLTQPDSTRPEEPQVPAGSPKYRSHRLKWGVIASVLLMVIAGGAVAGIVLTSTSSDSNKFEEASQIYSLDADCPAEVGSLVKISETALTSGLEEIGAVAGRIVEYADDTDHVLVMAYTFASQNSARQAFEKLDGDYVGEDFYRMDCDDDVCYFCHLFDNIIYLASGSTDNVVDVIDSITAANCL
jgi:DNA-directed RNA polymerase subunit M/transcription elongation factor TFIIS